MIDFKEGVKTSDNINVVHVNNCVYNQVSIIADDINFK